MTWTRIPVGLKTIIVARVRWHLLPFTHQNHSTCCPARSLPPGSAAPNDGERRPTLYSHPALPCPAWPWTLLTYIPVGSQAPANSLTCAPIRVASSAASAVPEGTEHCRPEIRTEAPRVLTVRAGTSVP